MKYDYKFSTTSFYCHRWWFYYYSPFKFVSGFNMRLFGINLRVTEIGARDKLIKLFIVSKRPAV